MKLKKRSGLTLVEVIISLIIISFVTVTLLAFFANGYSNLLGLRRNNVENSEIQKFFEEKISSAKKDGILDSDLDPNDRIFQYDVNGSSAAGIPVKGKVINYDKNPSRKISLFVSKRKEAVLEITGTVTVTLEDASDYYYVGEQLPKPQVTVSGVDGGNSRQKTDYDSQWLLSYRTVGKTSVVSVGSFVDADKPEAAGKIVPNMTDINRDVKLLDIKDESVVTSDMRGKFITYGARLYNTFGRAGAFNTSQRLWILGLPVADATLRAHSDADLATDETGAPIPSDGVPVERTEVRNLATNTILSQTIPVMSVLEDRIEQVRSFFALNNNQLKFTGIDTSRGSTTSFLLGNRRQSGEILSYEFDSTMSLRLHADENGNLTFNMNDSSGINTSSASRTINGRSLNYNADNVITLVTTVSGNNLRVNLLVNGQSWSTIDLAMSSNRGRHNLTSSAVSFAGNSYINEFAVYSRALSDNELDSIHSYLANKYNKDQDLK